MKLKTLKYKLLFKPDWFLGVKRINEVFHIIGLTSLSAEYMKKIIKEVRIKIEIDKVK